jgi:nucleotide-binding universal stress UspA family protein
MKTILVPLDGSALAEQVLPYVRLMAPVLNARVKLLRIVSEAEIEQTDAMLYQMATVYGAGEAIAAEREHLREMLEARSQQARNYLAGQAERLGEYGLQVSVDVVIGHAPELIAEVADHEDVALIAMATHGYGGLRRWALGSVADKVIHITDTPVLLVRGTATPPAAPPKLQRILVPLDGSGLSKQALPMATRIAVGAQAEILLLRAVRPIFDVEMMAPPMARMVSDLPDVSISLRNYTIEELQEAATRLKGQGVAVSVAAPFGDPAESIVDEALAHSIDLIVMATHGYGGLRRWALGSVADKVLHATTTPLLLVRATASAP